MREARPRRLSNVVFMGMGEPLANYDRVWGAVVRLHGEMGLSARHLTLSTVGLVPGIRRLATETLPVNLAVSLHAANDALRDELVPINRRYPLAVLAEACAEYVAASGRRLSIEWALIDGVNDRGSDAAELAEFARPLGAHVNLIPLNPTPGYPVVGSPPARVRRFRDELVALGVNATIRVTRGADIDAACGQLAAASPAAGGSGATPASDPSGWPTAPGVARTWAWHGPGDRASSVPRGLVPPARRRDRRPDRLALSKTRLRPGGRDERRRAPPREVLQAMLVATAVIHAGEALAAGRMARRRGLSPRGWRLQTFIVGFPVAAGAAPDRRRPEARAHRGGPGRGDAAARHGMLAPCQIPTPSTLAGGPSAAWASAPCSCPGPACSGRPRTATARWPILRRVVEAGVNHIDTAQFYGPDVANELIREALHPYPEDLVLVSKVGARRDESGQWLAAQRPEELRAGVEANLASLGLDQVPVVNLRRHPGSDVPFDEQLAAMVALRDEGLIGGIGLSTVSLDEYRQGAAATHHRLCAERLQRRRPLRPGRVRRLRRRRRALRAVLPARLRLLARQAGAAPPGGRGHRGAAGRDAGPGGAGLAAAAWRRTCCSSRAPRRSSTSRRTWPRPTSCSTLPRWPHSAEPGAPWLPPSSGGATSRERGWSAAESAVLPIGRALLGERARAPPRHPRC